MRRDEVLATLRAHEVELRDAGVAALSVFGSLARDDAGSASDIDALVRLHEQRLHDILGSEVDVVAEPVRKERLRSASARDRVVAF
ncbi:MAG TPA: nucleotidyltransferase domain-containing protein [Acetobacteraceae bacterium]